MISFNKVKSSGAQINDALRDIEDNMDLRLQEGFSCDLPHAFVIVEDYPSSVLERLPILVEKYRKNGWDAQYNGGHFIIFFKPEQKREFVQRESAEVQPVTRPGLCWIPVIGVFVEFYYAAHYGENYVSDPSHPIRYLSSIAFQTVSFIVVGSLILYGLYGLVVW
jgi:hypothetical protein